MQKKSIFLFLIFSLPSFLLAQNTLEPQSIDEKIDHWIAPATKVIESIIFYPLTFGSHPIPFILIWLILGAFILTFYLKFINLRGFKHAIDIVKGKYTHKGDPGEVTHFQALATALSGTVGLG